MASTNKTTNLELSKFLGTDKPAWLTDYNSDMEKIDNGYKKNADDIAGIDSRTTDLETGLGDSNTEIETVKNDVQALKDEDVIIKRDINTLAANYDTIHHEVAVNTQNIEDVKLKDTQQDEEIQGIKNDYLPLSGGTMKGELVLGAQNNLVLKSDFVRGSELANDKYSEITIKDKNNKNMFALSSRMNRDGSYRAGFYVYANKEDNEGVSALLGKEANGNVTFLLSESPAANCHARALVTAEWVRNLLVSLGISSAASTQLDNTESEGSV